MQTNFKATYQTAINAPIEKVWDALTKPELVKLSFGANMETDWKVGSPIVFNSELEDNKIYRDNGIVLEFVPNQKLSFCFLSDWKGLEDKPENYLEVVYEVKQIADRTALTITQSNYDEENAKYASETWKTSIDGLKKIVE